MTDNCNELRQAILFLCVFHTLQQVWRWIYGKEHGISASDRVEIMTVFKSLLYAKDLECLALKIESIEGNTTIQVYIIYKYIQCVFLILL